MYSLIVQNKYGQELELTGNPNYSISEIDGIDPPDATINTTKNAGADGSEYNSSYANNRQITITLFINSSAQTNRINLYKYFKTKFPVRLLYANSDRNVYIDGYVQTIQVGFFEKKQTAQIVIICPKPYFNTVGSEPQEFGAVEPLFEFPFAIEEAGIEFSTLVSYVEKSIINGGDVETGVLIEIKVNGPVNTPKIYNVETNEYFILNTSLQDADLVTINTRRGEKAVTLTRNGQQQSIVGLLQAGSTWFQLNPGDNLFTVNANEGYENMSFVFTVIDQFEGV